MESEGRPFPSLALPAIRVLRNHQAPRKWAGDLTPPGSPIGAPASPQLHGGKSAQDRQRRLDLLRGKQSFRQPPLVWRFRSGPLPAPSAQDPQQSHRGALHFGDATVVRSGVKPPLRARVSVLTPSLRRFWWNFNLRTLH